MMKRFQLLFLSSVTLLGSCLSAPPGQDYRSDEGALLGDYLVGSYADYIDDANNRALYYSRAYEMDKENVALGRRAVTSAVLSGDTLLSRKLARDILSEKKDEPMSRAVLGAENFANNQLTKAVDYLDVKTSNQSMMVLINIMHGWTEAAKGNVSKAENKFDELAGGPYFKALEELLKAKLAAYEKDYAGALEILNGNKLTTYEKAMGQFSPIETTLTHARILSKQGKNDEAKELLTAFNDAHDGFESGPIWQYLQKLNRGENLDINLTAQQEAARVLTEVSFGFFVRNRAQDVAEIYLRMAQLLDPEYDKAKLWLAALIENGDRSDEALELYKSISGSSAYIVSAKLSEANIYFDRDEDDKAIKILENTNREHDSFVTRESLGRARLIRENYAEALPIYQQLVDSMSEEDLKANTQPLYFRGICYEREKQWDKAIADFKHVLKIDPDNADALNYLGYTWVDRNENLTEAFEMIRRAVELEPESGAIVDSLGWAHYKLGQYHEARINLEKAVELTPYSATIIDHLGDVYWKLGRLREAGYQWKRALDFDPTDEERVTINKKLTGGLEAVRAAP